MPPKKRVVPADDKADKTILEELEIDEQAEADEEQLADFLGQFGGGEFTVLVDKFNETRKQWEYVDQYPAESFEPYEKCKLFGGGKYRLTPRKAGRYFKVGVRPVIFVADTPALVTAGEPSKKEESDPLKHPMVVMLMAMQEKSSSQMIEILKTVAARPEAPKSTTNEVMDMIVKLKQLEPKEGGMEKDLMKMLLPIMLERAFDKGDSSEGGEQSFLTQLKEGLEAFKLMKGQLPALPSRPQTQAQLPKTTESAAMPNTPAPLAVMLEGYVRQFEKWAKRDLALGSLPEEWERVEEAAEYLVDELTNEVAPLIAEQYKAVPGVDANFILQQMIDRSQKPEEVDRIFAYAPSLLPYKGWVLRVVAEAVEIMTTPPEAEPEAGSKENAEAPQA